MCAVVASVILAVLVLGCGREAVLILFVVCAAHREARRLRLEDGREWTLDAILYTEADNTWRARYILPEEER